MSGFKFDFQLDEQELDDEFTPQQGDQTHDQSGPEELETEAQQASSNVASGSGTCYHLSLDDLLDSLPETISYTPLSHPLLKTPLLRRDLFDARFQLISETQSSGTHTSRGKGKGKALEDTQASSDSPEQARDDDEGPGGDDYVDSATDLIPGLYEGGLKTWEGGTDLMEVMIEGLERDPSWLRRLRLLEVGCGTALPSCFLLHSILAGPPIAAQAASASTILHLQDFNESVLKLVTLPNLLLAALPFLSADSLRSGEDAPDVEDVLADLDGSGHLEITDELKVGFRTLLEQHGVQIRFTYGHWAGLAKDLQQKQNEDKGQGEGYGLVITAETIYAENSVEDLVAVLKSSRRSTSPVTSSVKAKSGTPAVEMELEHSFEGMTVRDDWVKSLVEGESVVLVASKVLYFGVGGGLAQFLQRIERDQGWWAGVKEWTKGVGRKVVRIGW